MHKNHIEDIAKQQSTAQVKTSKSFLYNNYTSIHTNNNDLAPPHHFASEPFGASAALQHRFRGFFVGFHHTILATATTTTTGFLGDHHR